MFPATFKRDMYGYVSSLEGKSLLSKTFGVWPFSIFQEEKSETRIGENAT